MLAESCKTTAPSPYPVLHGFGGDAEAVQHRDKTLPNPAMTGSILPRAALATADLPGVV